jgi:ERCC4-type nuclease
MTVKSRKIVVDTREKKPYGFDGEEVIRKALSCGDYSLEGLENVISIERKSLDDWLATITYSQERFSREMARFKGYDEAYIVVEGSIPDIMSGKYKIGYHPNALLGKSMGLILYNPHVRVLFCTDRPHAVSVTTELLKLMERKYSGWQAM